MCLDAGCPVALSSDAHTPEQLGFGYAEALAEAQAKGFAEADPAADVSGSDAAQKISLLASLAFGTWVDWRAVLCEGITAVTQRDIAYKVMAAGLDPNEVKVHEIHSKPLVVVNPDLDVKYVARLMTNMKLSRAPVIFDGKVQGIVSVILLDAAFAVMFQNLDI